LLSREPGGRRGHGADCAIGVAAASSGLNNVDLPAAESDRARSQIGANVRSMSGQGNFVDTRKLV